MTLADKTITSPVEFIDILTQLETQILRTINCVKMGQVQSFDKTKKTATVQILLQRVLPDDTTVDYPVLVDCPVMTLQGGGGYLQFPIQSGDQGLLLFADRNIDAWFKTGSVNPPNDSRCHHLSDGFFICGINALSSSLDNYTTKTVWKYDGSEIDMSGGIITIKNMTTSLLTLLDGLIGVIETLQVQEIGPLPLTAASIAALEAYKLQLALLLA